MGVSPAMPGSGGGMGLAGAIQPGGAVVAAKPIIGAPVQKYSRDPKRLLLAKRKKKP
jgi:hypothetical protein